MIWSMENWKPLCYLYNSLAAQTRAVEISENFRIATSIHIAVAQFELECYKSSQNIFKCTTNNKSSDLPSEQNQIHFNLKFVKPSKLKILLNIRFVVPALSTYAVSFIAALKAWCAVECCMNCERWIPVALWRNNITCFWHWSRSLFVTGWMWYVSAVVSRILLKNESAGTMGNLTNIQVEVSTCKPCWRCTTAKVNKNASATGANRRLKHIWYFHSMMRFVDIVIIAFLEGVHSSHGHVLLNMRYNTTLIAIIG